jgi:hypothetical protein
MGRSRRGKVEDENKRETEEPAPGAGIYLPNM